MEPDTYITSHYGSSPIFERVGIAKELQCSIRAQSQVPDHLTCSAPGSLCRVPQAIFRNHDTAEHWASHQWPQILQKLMFE